MSIEWLLTKAPDTETQKKPLERTQEEGGLSDKVHSSKPIERERAADNDEAEKQPGDKNSSTAEIKPKEGILGALLGRFG